MIFKPWLCSGARGAVAAGAAGRCVAAGLISDEGGSGGAAVNWREKARLMRCACIVRACVCAHRAIACILRRRLRAPLACRS